MKKIKNLTPHAVTIFIDNDESITIEPEGIIARCDQTNAPAGYIKTEYGSIQLSKTWFGKVYDLPKQEKDNKKEDKSEKENTDDDNIVKDNT